MTSTAATESPAGIGASRRRFVFSDRFAACSLVILALTAYLPALGAGFVWDDDPLILSNPLMIGLGGLRRIWTTISLIPHEDHWRPLQYSVLWLEHWLWGWNAAGFHFVNLALNAAVSFLLWRLLRRLSLPGAWIAAALFAVHPAHVESTAWIVDIKDLSSALFYLLAVALFLDFDDLRDAPSKSSASFWPLTGMFIAAAAGMLCKSVVATLPAGLAILIWFRRGKFERRDFRPLILAACAVAPIAVADMIVTRLVGQTLPGDVPSLALRLAKSGWNFWFYIGKLVWPLNLSCVYPQWKIDPSRIAAWVPLACACVATLALWLLRRRIGRGPLACWLFYGISLTPMIGVVHFSFMTITPVADRYQYLASIGPIAGVGCWIGAALARGSSGKRTATAALAIMLILLFSAKTWSYSTLFQDPPALFFNAIRFAPESEVASTNLAVGLMRAQRWKEAETVLEKSIALRPSSIDALYNLGTTMIALGDDRRGIDLFRRALKIKPEDLTAMDALAWALATSPDAALRDPLEALRVAEEVNQRTKIENPKYLATLAAAQAASGDSPEARKTIRRAETAARLRGTNGFLKSLEDQQASYDNGEAYSRTAPGDQSSTK